MLRRLFGNDGVKRTEIDATSARNLVEWALAPDHSRAEMLASRAFGLIEKAAGRGLSELGDAFYDERDNRATIDAACAILKVRGFRTSVVEHRVGSDYFRSAVQISWKAD
jgi:hypothetical protein